MKGQEQTEKIRTDKKKEKVLNEGHDRKEWQGQKKNQCKKCRHTERKKRPGGIRESEEKGMCINVELKVG